MSPNNRKSRFTTGELFAGICGGALVGAWYVKNRNDNQKKSQAEKADPDLVAEVCEEIWTLLDEYDADEADSEDEYVNELFEYLDQESGYQIERYPATDFGIPDILLKLTDF